MINDALYSSNNMNWCTPQDFFEELNQEYHFELDAAATDKSAKCSKYYTPADDGLSQPWTTTGGAIFCNPPYGRNVKHWVKKAYEESKTGITIVLLIPARTDTTWFHDYIYGKADIKFIKGRLTFTDEDGNPSVDKKGRRMPAPFPSMVVTYNRKGD